MKWPWNRSKDSIEHDAYVRGANEAIRAMFDAGIVNTGQRGDKPVHYDNPWAYAVYGSPQRRPYSLVDVRTLRLAADSCDHVRAAINHLKREVLAIEGDFVAVDEDDDSPAVREAIADAKAFFSPHGGLGEFGRRRAIYEHEILEDLLVIGCSAVWCERTRGGELHAAIPIDASTIRPVRDAFGWTDPDHAYEQYIQGVIVESFSVDELIYDGVHAVTHTPYYKSAVEWIFSPIISVMSSDEWNRSWLTTGNAPGDDVYTLPGDLKPNEIKTWVNLWAEVLSGNTQERQKLRFLPGGSSKLTNGSRRDMAFQEFELWLLRRICAVFGVTAASIGYAGEQYKISQEKSTEQTSQFGAGELLEFRAAHYNELLRRLGLGELICWRDRQEAEETAGEKSTRLVAAAGGPYKTVNEARGEDGLDPVEGGDELRLAPGAEDDDDLR